MLRSAMSDAATTAESNRDSGLNGSWVELEMNRAARSTGGQAPGLLPQSQAPGLLPQSQAPGLLTLSQTPGLQPQAPGLLPLSQAPGLLPLSQAPGLLPLPQAEEEEALAGGLEHVPSSSSIHNGDMERILLDALESSRSNSSCDSPPRPHSPEDEGQILFDVDVTCRRDSQSEVDSLDQQRDMDQQRDVEVLMRDSDWVADWSSRPENIPPKEFHFRHPRRSVTLSMRKSGAMKKGGVFSAEFLKVFIPSLLLSHILALGLGVYIGKRLATPPASSF